MAARDQGSADGADKPGLPEVSGRPGSIAGRGRLVGGGAAAAPFRPTGPGSLSPAGRGSSGVPLPAIEPGRPETSGKPGLSAPSALPWSRAAMNSCPDAVYFGRRGEGRHGGPSALDLPGGRVPVQGAVLEVRAPPGRGVVFPAGGQTETSGRSAGDTGVVTADGAVGLVRPGVRRPGPTRCTARSSIGI